MIPTVESSSHGSLTDPYKSSKMLDREQRRRRVATAIALSVVVVVSVVVALALAV